MNPRHLLAPIVGVLAAVATVGSAVLVLTTGGRPPLAVVPRDVASLTREQRIIVALARSHGPDSGILYVWGGTGPPGGFDCSGFVWHVLGQAGISVPRTSQAMWNDNGTVVNRSELRPGDVLFFVGANGTFSNPGHVGFDLGDKVVEYWSTGKPARIDALASHSDYVGARRWWWPLRIRRRDLGAAVWIARHWGIRIRGSTGDTIVFVPAGPHPFARWKRAAIVRWAHRHGHATSGNRQHLNIRLKP
jgi:hypothetical protein